MERSRVGSGEVKPPLEVFVEICLCPRFLEYNKKTWRSGEAFVLLVDYGNVSVIKISEIRSTIYADRLPVLAHRAVIHNIVPAGT